MWPSWFHTDIWPASIKGMLAGPYPMVTVPREVVSSTHWGAGTPPWDARTFMLTIAGRDTADEKPAGTAMLASSGRKQWIRELPQGVSLSGWVARPLATRPL